MLHENREIQLKPDDEDSARMNLGCSAWLEVIYWKVAEWGGEDADAEGLELDRADMGSSHHFPTSCGTIIYCVLLWLT